MPYPTYLDLQVFLDGRGLGCHNLQEQDLKDAIAVAIEKWEDDTDWHPFLAVVGEEPEERIIDGPEGRMMFPNFGIVSLAGLGIDGNDYTLNTDFYLQHKITNGPYQAIETGFYVTGTRRAVTLSGVFGYTTTLPARAKTAILSSAAFALYPLITGLEGDIKREKQGPVEFEYQQASGESAGYQGKRGQLYRDYEEAVRYYKRATL